MNNLTPETQEKMNQFLYELGENHAPAAPSYLVSRQKAKNPLSKLISKLQSLFFTPKMKQYID